MAEPARKSTVILAALALCMALQMTGFIMILPLFARRLESFNAGAEALAGSALAYALAATVSAPVMGILADRIGRRPIVLFSLAAYALAFGGYLFAASAWEFIELRGLAGLFTAGLVPAMTSMIGDLAPEDQRARWIGIVMGGASAGWILGPIFGGELYDRYGSVVPFALSIAMELAALLLACLLVRETHVPSARPASPVPLWSGFYALPAFHGFSLLMLVSFGVLFAWAFIEAPFMFYVYDDLGWTSSRLGLVMSIYGLACMIGEFTLSHLSDRLGRRPVLLVGLALFSAQFIGLVLFRDAGWIMASFVLAGLGNSLFDPALSAFLLDITPAEQTARVMGLRSTAGSLGNLVGPGLFVLLTPFAGTQAVFLIAAGSVWLLLLASAFGLGLPQTEAASTHVSSAAVARQGE